MPVFTWCQPTPRPNLKHNNTKQIIGDKNQTPTSIRTLYRRALPLCLVQTLTLNPAISSQTH
jgi:hypothetical protein